MDGVRLELFRDYTVDAARRLVGLPAGHKCANLHGHTFFVRMWFAGELDAKTGMLVDFAEIDRAVGPVLERLDHHYLNDVAGLEQPTTEMIAVWLWKQARRELPNIVKIEVRESATAGVVCVGA